MCLTMRTYLVCVSRILCMYLCHSYNQSCVSAHACHVYRMTGARMCTACGGGRGEGRRGSGSEKWKLMSQIKADTVRFVVLCALCCQESWLLSTIACCNVRCSACCRSITVCVAESTWIRAPKVCNSLNPESYLKVNTQPYTSHQHRGWLSLASSPLHPGSP